MEDKLCSADKFNRCSKLIGKFDKLLSAASALKTSSYCWGAGNMIKDGEVVQCQNSGITEASVRVNLHWAKTNANSKMRSLPDSFAWNSLFCSDWFSCKDQRKFWFRVSFRAVWVHLKHSRRNSVLSKPVVNENIEGPSWRESEWKQRRNQCQILHRQSSRCISGTCFCDMKKRRQRWNIMKRKFFTTVILPAQ